MDSVTSIGLCEKCFGLRDNLFGWGCCGHQSCCFWSPSPIQRDGATVVIRTIYRDALRLGFWVNRLPVTEAAPIAAPTPSSLNVPGVECVYKCGQDRVPILPVCCGTPSITLSLVPMVRGFEDFPKSFCALRVFDWPENGPRPISKRSDDHGHKFCGNRYSQRRTNIVQQPRRCKPSLTNGT